MNSKRFEVGTVDLADLIGACVVRSIDLSGCLDQSDIVRCLCHDLESCSELAGGYWAASSHDLFGEWRSQSGRNKLARDCADQVGGGAIQQETAEFTCVRPSPPNDEDPAGLHWLVEQHGETFFDFLDDADFCSLLNSGVASARAPDGTLASIYESVPEVVGEFGFSQKRPQRVSWATEEHLESVRWYMAEKWSDASSEEHCERAEEAVEEEEIAEDDGDGAEGVEGGDEMVEEEECDEGWDEEARPRQTCPEKTFLEAHDCCGCGW